MKLKHAFIIFIIPTIYAITIFVTCLGFFYKDPFMDKDGPFHFPYTHWAFPEISNTAMFKTSSFYGYRTTIFSAGLSSCGIMYMTIFYLLSKVYHRKHRRWILGIGGTGVVGLYCLAMFPPSPPMHVHTFFASVYFIFVAIQVSYLTGVEADIKKNILFYFRVCGVTIVWMSSIVMGLVPTHIFESALQHNQQMNAFMASQYTQTIKASMEWLGIVLCTFLVLSFFPRLKQLSIKIDVEPLTQDPLELEVIV